jgi:hypothetical protein
MWSACTQVFQRYLRSRVWQSGFTHRQIITHGTYPRAHSPKSHAGSDKRQTTFQAQATGSCRQYTIPRDHALLSDRLSLTTHADKTGFTHTTTAASGLGVTMLIIRCRGKPLDEVGNSRGTYQSMYTYQCRLCSTRAHRWQLDVRYRSNPILYNCHCCRRSVPNRESFRPSHSPERSTNGWKGAISHGWIIYPKVMADLHEQ